MVRISKPAVVVAVAMMSLHVLAAVVAARGDPDAGAILLKLNGRDGGCAVLAQTRRADGSLVWMRATGAAPVAESEADGYIERQRRRDPDLWVVEIDSGAAEALLDLPIIA